MKCLIVSKNKAIKIIKLSKVALTLKIIFTQVVETSVAVTNSSFQNTHPDDHTGQTRQTKIIK